MQLPKGTCGMIRSKSGLMKKKGIITDGVIDAGYTGQIGVTLINTTNKKVWFEKGDKVAQIVILPVEYPNLILTDVLEETERGESGFGSSGK